jgi:hypothetical protein
MRMATIHISADETTRDFAALLAQVRAGTEVVHRGWSADRSRAAHAFPAAPIHRGMHRSVAGRLLGDDR